ncbi:MAG: PaaI family thioesterase [Armatimonadetes bacterium]|nr:PaaI family thioesterase [Armatimonadota bacterium]
MLRVSSDDYCFACGSANPHGLHLTGFSFDGNQYLFRFTPAPHHQGWRGITHGGIIATVLDEAMTRLLWEKGRPAVTAELKVRYRRPLPVGTSTRVRAWQIGQRGRLIFLAAVIEDDEDEYARSEATYFAVSEA